MPGPSRWFSRAAVSAGLAVALAGCGGPLERLEDRLAERIAQSEGVVGLYFLDLETGDTLAVNADDRFHAASTMKVPVMIQVFRDAQAGWFSLDDSVPVTDTFRSIVDGSPYRLTAEADSDSTLYGRIGEPATIRELADLMTTVSSNLAANMLIELAGAERVGHTARELGADSMEVLRGVEDIEAYEAGLNNTTTARDLGVIFAALAEERAADPDANREMMDILFRQRFNDGLPAGLPDGVRVAHKTGSITRVNHDAGVVELPDGRRYVLVVLTRGIEDPEQSDALIADLSRIVYEHVTAGG